jgi:hypothetical protein
MKKRANHMFRDEKWHLSDNADTRSLIQSTAKQPGAYLGTDKHGKQWYSRILADGTQA